MHIQSGLHFLDAVPFTLALPGARDLLELLTAAYWGRDRAQALAASAGVRKVDWRQPVEDAWYAALREASARAGVRPLLKKVLEDEQVSAYHGRLCELLAKVPAIDPPAGHAREMMGAGEDLGGEGRPSQVDIAALWRALQIAPAVVRLTVTTATGRYCGTGVLIDGNRILTSHHVLHDWSNGGRPASAVEIRFRYETDANGAELPCDIYPGIAAAIAGDRGDDWAVVPIDGALEHAYPAIHLAPPRPPVAGDPVYLIQHPRGMPKRIGLCHNDVLFTDGRVVHYRTDAEGSSSGTPIFNDRWEMVALHHRWIEAGRQGEQRVFRNEGIRIERVIDGLARLGR